MSAYAHQMEREFSSRSLSTRGDSEMGSRYMIESGFYMTAFAAAIFVGALVTVGVLFITLLIALTLMLQSCEIRSKGIIEIQNTNDDHNYCKIFALHAELNNLGPKEFPSICRSLEMQNIIGSQYGRDLNISMSLVDRYFNGFVPSNDGLDAILMDLDDFLPSDPPHDDPYMHGLNHRSRDCFAEAELLRQRLILRIYTKLQTRGWSLILLSRRPETLRNATMKHLTTAGYNSSSLVIMRSDNEMDMASHEYISNRKVLLQKEGYLIAGIISSRLDSLTGPYSEQHTFKLPNPTYYCLDYPVKNTNEPK